MPTVSVLNVDAGLSAKTLVNLEDTQTVTGAKTFDRDPSAPYAVTAGSAVVTNLDADLLDGQEGSWYRDVMNATLVSPWCQGRLTLTSGTPVTTADVTGATTIYFAPYGGHLVSLYSGSAWGVYTLSEVSLAMGTLSSGLPYDVFLYNNGGTLTLEFTAWTNGTTRATALTTQNGVLVRTGATTRRYLGTFYTTSTTQTEDSYARRLLWNNYHRVARPLRITEATDSWSYTTATWRQVRAAAANQVDLVCGWAEDALMVSANAHASNSAGGNYVAVGIGQDSTTAFVSGMLGGYAVTAGANIITSIPPAQVILAPTVGYHYYAWLEYAAAAGTTTWYGDNNTPTLQQSGLHALWRA